MDYVGTQKTDKWWYGLLKLACLTFAFFLLIGAYTIARELKDSVFLAVVGKEYIPWAKMLSMIVFIPSILFYSRLVDLLRRSHLVYVYTITYALIGLLFALFFGHGSIGLVNTDSSPYRLLGWLFYFFVEGYPAFLLSVFWAFAASINSPNEAKRTYALIVAGSKLGGVVTAFLAWVFLTWNTSFWAGGLSEPVQHQVLLAVSSCFLLCVPLVIYVLLRFVPGALLHGYEAVYKMEKQKARDRREETGTKKVQPTTAGLFSGLYLLFKYPYVMGIFGMIFFHEIVATVFSYQRLAVSQSIANSTSGVTAFLFQQAFGSQLIAFFIAIIGTHTLLRVLGTRRCLLLVPLATGVLLAYFLIVTGFGIGSQATAIMIVYMGLRAIHYAFSAPLRETLYIPTIKDVKFKSKSWIDSFGSKLSKAGGSTFNVLTAAVHSARVAAVQAGFFGIVVILWMIVSYLLGRRYDKAIKDNEVIGN